NEHVRSPLNATRGCPHREAITLPTPLGEHAGCHFCMLCATYRHVRYSWRALALAGRSGDGRANTDTHKQGVEEDPGSQRTRCAVLVPLTSVGRTQCTRRGTPIHTHTHA